MVMQGSRGEQQAISALHKKLRSSMHPSLLESAPSFFIESAVGLAVELIVITNSSQNQQRMQGKFRYGMNLWLCISLTQWLGGWCKCWGVCNALDNHGVVKIISCLNMLHGATSSWEKEEGGEGVTVTETFNDYGERGVKHSMIRRGGRVVKLQ